MKHRNSRALPAMPIQTGTDSSARRAVAPYRLKNSRRHRKKLVTREKIRRHAISMFRARGVGSTSIEAITERCDVGKGTFFNYFENKDAVLAAHYAELEDAFNRELDRLDPIHPLASLTSFFGKIERLLRAEGKLIYALHRAVFTRDLLSQHDRQSQKHDLEQYRQFLVRAHKARTLPHTVNADLVATLICDVWQGSLYHWLGAKQKHSLATEMRKKLDYILVRPRSGRMRGKQT